jgi:hypothetical protein
MIPERDWEEINGWDYVQHVDFRFPSPRYEYYSSLDWKAGRKYADV